MIEHEWSDATLHRVAAGLLKIAADFDLLKGTVAKQFTSYHLPERSFIYLLHAISGTRTKSGTRTLRFGLAIVPNVSG